jgi:putative transposase
MKSSQKTGNTLAQKISDVSWYKFYSQLEYKANWENKKILKINRWFASSKTCSKCGYIMEEMSLNIRKWDCPNCNSIGIDRDVNAAINILNEGLKQLA